jgi:uncharacterized membrane protein YozB (DUF420 family)
MACSATYENAVSPITESLDGLSNRTSLKCRQQVKHSFSIVSMLAGILMIRRRPKPQQHRGSVFRSWFLPKLNENRL